MRAFPATQAVAPADEDELDGFEIVPIDLAADPDDVLRSRPFIMGELAYETAFPGTQLRKPNRELATEEGSRQALIDFLSLRGVDGDSIAGAVERFDSRKVKKIAPDPKLRAAILMLTGWDPYKTVLAAILDGENPSGAPYQAAVFDRVGMDGAIATLHEDPASGRHVLTIDDAHDGNDPETLIPTIVHESLHGGGANSAEEEIAASLLDALCWGELLLIKPELASYGTDLTLVNNIMLLGLLNSSGRAGPGQIGVATSAVGDIYVGDGLETVDAESIRAAIEQEWFYSALRNVGSDGQQTTAALVRRFPGGKGLGPAPRYDETLLAVIDSGVSKVLPPDKVVVLAATLGLDVAASFREGRARGSLSDDAEADLDRRPFVASDRKLFSYSTGKKTGKPIDESKARAVLEEFLGRTSTERDVTDALIARFDDPATITLVPDPSLRAAVLMLGGLPPWDLVLPAVFEGKNPDGMPLRIYFQPMRDSAPAARLSNRDGDDDEPALVINGLLAGEPPQLLASIIVEAVLLHDDALLKEEAIAASALGTLAWADIILADPGSASGRTWGVLQRNLYVLALLNTGSNNGMIGLLRSHGAVTDILPGIYTDATTFATFIDSRPWGSRFIRHGELVAPKIFGSFLLAAGITPATGTRGKMTFGDATLVNLDAAVGWYLPPDKAHAVARILRLGTAVE